MYYSVDFTKHFALEGNLRLTYYVSKRIGISAACKAAYMKIPESTAIAVAKKQFTVLPWLDFTYLIRPDRGEIQHGLFKNRKKMR